MSSWSPPLASMGPRSLDRGISDGLPQPRGNIIRFNGAAISRSRNRDRPPACRQATGCFNGAAISRSRNRDLPAVRPGICLASMGPRSLDRGIVESAEIIQDANQLQWGRDLSIAESPRSDRTAPCARAGFNGAAISRSRNLYQLLAENGVRMASMGPRSLDRGIGGIGPFRGTACHASMGPRSLDRGIWGIGVKAHWCFSASMGPRSLDRGISVRGRAQSIYGTASMGPRSLDRGISGSGSWVGAQ